MKRVLLSGLALLTFSAFYGQQTELKEERLTVKFEKKWSTAATFSPSEVFEVTEGLAYNYEDQIASYAPVFLDISLKDQFPRKEWPMPIEMHVFIIRHKD